jgi:hypothetical protein
MSLPFVVRSALTIVVVSTALVGQDLAARMGALIEAHTKVNHFSGVALVAKDGNIVFEKAYGFATSN